MLTTHNRDLYTGSKPVVFRFDVMNDLRFTLRDTLIEALH